MRLFQCVPDSKIVELSVDGDSSRGGFEAGIEEINSKIEAYGSVDVLEEIRSIGKMPPPVWWDDLKWAVGHWRKIGRTAVVCDKRWIEKMAKLLQPLMSADVRHFDLADIEEAHAWLRRDAD